MTTLLLPLAAWILALKMANDGDSRSPPLLGAVAGGVFAASAWLEVIVFHSSMGRAALATPLYIAAGAILVRLFSQVEGILAGVAVVVVGTCVMFWGVPAAAAALLPGVDTVAVVTRRVNSVSLGDWASLETPSCASALANPELAPAGNVVPFSRARPTSASLRDS